MPYKTPGVYVEEIPSLAPSVAEVATAIPAFIGATQAGPAGAVELAEISTMLEYEQRFGGAKAASFSVAVSDGAIASITRDDAASPNPSYFLHEALSLYFKNGGGRCYVISVADTSSDLTRARFEAGLAELERHDEPTLIVAPEAVNLEPGDFQSLCQQALAQCKKLQDRFAIFDVQDGDVEAFRSNTGTDALDYGAAYHPYLQSSLSFSYDAAAVAITGEGYAEDATLASIESSNTALYNQIKKALTAERVVLPPSAAIAGAYARVDRDRGVWKAPANVSLSSVIGPTERVTADEQEGLNVDANSGKSINVIRAFTGMGTLIWGARTLAGNDNEWRYVSVRRLFIMIEESARKATAFAVFEPNDASTWLKVKGMLESYLYGLWEQGALQGSTPEAAYYVNVGLGKTMTSQDVLEGRMIVEIGVAAVRPAEFIVLRFSHKLVEG